MNVMEKPAAVNSGSTKTAERGNARSFIISQAEMVVKNEAGRPVGSVKDDVLIKHVDARKHQLRTPPAWACDETVLMQAKNLGACSVVLEDDNAKVTWEARINRFWEKGSFKIDRGFGVQRVLPLRYWIMLGNDIPAQLSLFGRAI